MTALLLVLLASPGTIRVEVTGGEAEVLALRDGVVRTRVATQKGRALLRGLTEGRYDLVARSAGHASALVRGVRTVHDAAPGVDAVLALSPVHPIRVRTEARAVVWTGGLAFDPSDISLPAGLHRIVVNHEHRVSSASRLVRVDGPAEIEMPLAPGLVVLGRVVDREGVPVAGALVEAFADGFATGRRAWTDAAGGFGLSGFYGDVISVRAAALGYAASLKRVDFYPGDERARTDIVLSPGSGVTLDANTAVDAVLLPGWYEDALEEPRLKANYVPARRSGRRIAFHGLAPGRTYRILLSARGFQPAATESFLAPAAGRAIALPATTLRRAASIRGSLAGRESGLWVVCRGPEGTSRSRTDRAGRFAFDGLDPGEHLLTLADVEERGKVVELTAGEQAQVELAVAPADASRVIEGLVMDADGKPLSGVVVRAARSQAISDEAGAFRLEGLPVGREVYRVHLSPLPTSRAFVTDPHLPHTEARVRVGAKLRVPLKRSGTLRLSFDAGGFPLARATLHVVSRNLRIRRRLARRAKDVVIHELPLGSYEIDLAAPRLLGTGKRVVAVRRGADDAIVVPVARGRRATGRVVLRRTVPRKNARPLISDRPLARAWVTLFSPDPAFAMAATPVEEDGSFVLDGLPLARVVLCAGAPGLPTTAIEVDLASANRRDLVIALTEAVRCAVIVTGEHEAPLPDARVRILDMLRPDFGVDVRDTGAVGRFRRVVAGDVDYDEVRRTFSWKRAPTGRVEALFLRPGSYSYLVSADGYRQVRVGVRARTEWQTQQIRENVPDAPLDLTTRIRLARKRADAKD